MSNRIDRPVVVGALPRAAETTQSTPVETASDAAEPSVVVNPFIEAPTKQGPVLNPSGVTWPQVLNPDLVHLAPVMQQGPIINPMPDPVDPAVIGPIINPMPDPVDPAVIGPIINPMPDPVDPAVVGPIINPMPDPVDPAVIGPIINPMPDPVDPAVVGPIINPMPDPVDQTALRPEVIPMPEPEEPGVLPETQLTADKTAAS